MAVEILVFFFHGCSVPVSPSTRDLLEKAMVKCVSPLTRFGLRGSIGDCDVLFEKEDSPAKVGLQVFSRVDLPEMELLVSAGVATLLLPILWTLATQDTGERNRLFEMLQTMVADLPVSYMAIAPCALDADVNSAYGSVLEVKGVAHAAKHLSNSARVQWLVRKADGSWSQENPREFHRASTENQCH
jgi:hypothetical protein